MAKTNLPTVGRPGRGFTTGRAERWILAAALITAVTYAFRRLVEPSLSSAPERGGQGSRMAGAGSPPPALAQWAIAYSAGFLMLSVIALGAPELAASLAMLALAGNLLANGTSLVADLTNLESGTASAATTTNAAPLTASQVKTEANVAAGAGNAPGIATSGLEHGAGTITP